MPKNIAIIGSGYIGSVLAGVLAEKGNFVTAIDVNKSIIESLRNGQSPIEEPGLNKLIKNGVKMEN